MYCIVWPHYVWYWITRLYTALYHHTIESPYYALYCITLLDIVLYHHTNITYCRLSVPAGAWEGEAMITKCRVKGGDQGVASCPIQLLTSTNTIPQQGIPSKNIIYQYGVRYILGLISLICHCYFSLTNAFYHFLNISFLFNIRYTQIVLTFFE